MVGKLPRRLTSTECPSYRQSREVSYSVVRWVLSRCSPAKWNTSPINTFFYWEGAWSMKSLSANINPSQCLKTISWIQPHYLINRQTIHLGLVLCDCRQARTSEKIRIVTQWSSRCKDGGRGTVVIGVDIREGVILWILGYWTLWRGLPLKGAAGVRPWLDPCAVGMDGSANIGSAKGTKKKSLHMMV